MILVIHDHNGFIQQAITHAECGLVELSKCYEENGVPHLLVKHEFDLTNSYVLDGNVVPRPEIAIEGVGDRPLRADGADTFMIETVPPCAVKVFFGAIEIGNAQTGEEPLELSSDHAGTFRLMFEAAWPYRAEVVVVEVLP